jgi:hypothetical protein
MPLVPPPDGCPEPSRYRTTTAVTRSHAIAFAVGLAFATGLGSPVWMFIATRPSLRVLQTWRQDDRIRYDGLGPYHLTVFESGTDWRGFPLFLRPTHALYVGRDPGTPSYGHEMPFAFHGLEPVEEQVSRCDVAWTEDGVAFTAPSGHRLEIPKHMFVGGR